MASAYGHPNKQSSLQSNRSQRTLKGDQKSGDWVEGDVAFLRPFKDFDDRDYCKLIKSGYLQRGATGHPVIILKRHSVQSTHVVITTVSAHRFGPDNGFLRPWEVHAYRNRLDFRSFHGSARSSDKYQSLHVANGRQFPKPEASWVDIRSAWVVPLTVLTTFTKSRVHLNVRADSLADLRAHMHARSGNYRGCLVNPQYGEEEDKDGGVSGDPSPSSTFPEEEVQPTRWQQPRADASPPTLRGAAAVEGTVRAGGAPTAAKPVPVPAVMAAMTKPNVVKLSDTWRPKLSVNDIPRCAKREVKTRVGI